MSAVGTTHNLMLGNQFLIIRPNSYTKRPAPTFGARITTGDPDYNNLSIWQHWVQKCWIGGMGAPEWIDDAMYDVGIGVDVATHEKAMLSHDLLKGTGANWNAGGNTNSGEYSFIVYGAKVYGLWIGDGTVISRLWKYNDTNDAWDTVTLPTKMVVRTMATFDGKFYIGGFLYDAPTVGKLYHATTPGTWTTRANPAGVTGPITCMKPFMSKLYVAYDTQIWREKDTQAWDGSTVFYKVNSNGGSNYIVSMEVYLGKLYMLSQNGHMHMTDGNNSFDIWSWDGQSAGVSLRAYDGKLFVSTYEWTVSVGQGVGVLYQFTGNAVTELKRWGKIDKSTRLGNMVVWGRKMYYGAGSLFGIENGFGIAVYDSAEDAHSIWAQNVDTTTYPDRARSGFVGDDWMVSDIIVWGERLFAGVNGHGFFYTPIGVDMTRRDKSRFTSRPGVAVLTNDVANGGFIQSSQYDAGTPGLRKMWRKITVYMDLPTAACSFRLYYNIGSGTTWVSASGAAESGPSDSSGQYVYYLENVLGPRIRYKIVMNTTDNAYSPTLRGVVIAYLPQPEPGWIWTFTVPVTDKWELMDGTIETKDTTTLIAYLEGLFRSQRLVEFTDVDGVPWTASGPGVLLYDVSTVYYDIDNPREGDVRITLLETVESY